MPDLDLETKLIAVNLQLGQQVDQLTQHLAEDDRLIKNGLQAIAEMRAERDALRAELDARTARPGLFGTAVYAAAAGIVALAIARGAGIL